MDESFSKIFSLLIQLLSSFEGKIVYPPQENKSSIFEKATEAIESLLIPNGIYTLSVKPRGVNVQVQATMSVKDGKMIVHKDSTLGDLKNISVASWKALRESLKTVNHKTIEDFEVTSPSMAAAIVLGYNSNGWTVWKNANGETIDIYRSHIDAQND